MHIMEGFLPVIHAIGWSVAAAPFVGYGLYTINKRVKQNPEQRMLLGVAAAFTFVLSALKIPSVTGSCSHPTGTGLGAVLFGPSAMAPIGAIVLLFQALLLAHGGITTLGANVFSMAILGPWVAWLVFRLSRSARLPFGPSVFLAASLADMATYITTAFQLAIAFPDPMGGILASFAKFAGVFALTQIPLAICEGILSVIVMNALMKLNQDEMTNLESFKAQEIKA